MDFTLDESQRAIAELASAVLRSDPDDARTRAAHAGIGGFDDTAWKAMAQAGLLTLAVPPAAGGDGFGAVETGLVLTEVGRQTLPLPALATLALGVLPVAAHAGADTATALLGGVADGDILTSALREAPGTSTTRSSRTITSTRIGVPYADQAGAVLVPLPDGTVVIDPHGPGVTLHRTPTSTGAPEYTLRADAAPVLHDLPLTDVDAEHYAIAGAAAVADGVLAGALELTSGHLRERQQFGRPLATFQAVAQQIADVYVIARTVHLAAVSCAWRLGNDRDAGEDVAVAAYWLAAELPKALQVCHHLHGGLGVDITYPLHRYYSHAKDLARFVGGAAHRLDLLGDRCCSN